MSDSELLELAAKAVGGIYDPLTNCITSDGGIEFEQWEPLEDDGDAFRLMVALNLEVERCKDGTRIYVGEYNCAPYMEETSDTQDILGAARRAIVQAAADIGRNIP